MKIKIGQIQLKTLNEEAYSSGFDKIEIGDEFVIKTKTNTYHGVVKNKLKGGGENKINVHISGKNFIIKSDSLRGSTLSSTPITNGVLGNEVLTSGIEKIGIYRNGNLFTTLDTSLTNSSNQNPAPAPAPNPAPNNSGNTNSNSGTPPPPKNPFYQNALDEAMVVLGSVKKDNKLTIEMGKLVTHDTIGTNTITKINLHIRSIFNDDIIKAGVTKIEGAEADKYSHLKDQFLKLSITKSLELSGDSVVLITKNHKTGNEEILSDVFELILGDFESTQEPTFDDMMQDKGFRDLMLKNPSMIQRVVGALDKGVIPATDIIKQLGLTNDYYTKGKKVKFIYSGSAVRKGQTLSLISGKEYIGIFSNSKTIRLSGERRGESLLVKLKRKLKDQIYEVNISFNKVKNGELVSNTDVGNGTVQITDSNFR